jgi:hypothetical protein
MRFPAPYVDEGWLAARAWALIQTGRAFGPFDVGLFDGFQALEGFHGFDGYWTYPIYFGTWLQSLGYRIVGTPTLFAIRIISLAFGGVLLIAIYVIGHQLYGKQFALFGTFLTSISIPFSYSAHMARPDIMAAAVGYVSIAITLTNHSRQIWKSALAGFLLGIAFELHPHAAIFGPTIVLLYLLESGLSSFFRMDFWGFIVGVSVGLLVYGSLHIFPYPETYFALNEFVYASSHTPPILTWDITIILQAFARTGELLLKLYPTFLPVIVLGVIKLIVHFSQDKKLLALTLSAVFSLTVLIGQKEIYYGILISPLLDLSAASFLLYFASHHKKAGKVYYAQASIIFGILFITIGWGLFIFGNTPYQSYQAIQQRLQTHIQPTDSVLAPPEFWFGLHENDYHSWQKISFYQYQTGDSLKNAVGIFQPDIIIFSDSLTAFAFDPTRAAIRERLSQSEFEAFFQREAEQLTSFESDLYGRIYVYRVIKH